MNDYQRALDAHRLGMTREHVCTASENAKTDQLLHDIVGSDAAPTPPYTSDTGAAWRLLRAYTDMLGAPGDTSAEHFTLLKFSSNWRFGLNVPHGDDADGGFRDRFPSAPTMALAVCRGILLDWWERQTRRPT